jgi:hypothetical protein
MKSGEVKKAVAAALAGVVAQQREVRCVGAAREARLHRIQQAIVPSSCGVIRHSILGRCYITANTMSSGRCNTTAQQHSDMRLAMAGPGMHVCCRCSGGTLTCKCVQERRVRCFKRCAVAQLWDLHVAEAVDQHEGNAAVRRHPICQAIGPKLPPRAAQCFDYLSQLACSASIRTSAAIVWNPEAVTAVKCRQGMHARSAQPAAGWLAGAVQACHSRPISILPSPAAAANNV